MTYDNKPSWPEFVLLTAGLAAAFFTLRARADQASDAALLNPCRSALGACDTLRTADQVLIQHLKDSVKVYKKAAEQPNREAPLVVWTGLAGGLGGAMAGMASNGKDGLAVGGIVGAGVGVAIGLIVGDGR